MLMRVLAIIFNALPVRWQRRFMTAGLIPAALS
jgi:hypothetical protein